MRFKDKQVAKEMLPALQAVRRRLGESENCSLRGYFIACGEEKFVDVFRKRSEEHTSELQSLMRISYAVFCLKKKKEKNKLHRRLIQSKRTTDDIRQYYTNKIK